MSLWLQVLVLVATAAATLTTCGVRADVYMHNPRGSNDRNCERNVNRNNGNLRFDSQNNAKGGYACPRGVGGPDRDDSGRVDKMYYYFGTKVPIEWTQQHGGGIGNGKLESVVVIEYATTETLDPTSKYSVRGHLGTPRDGIPRDNQDAATETIPNNQENGPANSVENRRYGLHETHDWYQEMCEGTARNRGLFNADQRVRRNDARGTRQNPNGNRRGLECPSERDYFPYWQPTPWMPVAILTSNPTRCEMYKQHFEQKMFGYCEVTSPLTNNLRPALDVNCTTRQGESQKCCPEGQWRDGVDYRQKFGEDSVPAGWFTGISGAANKYAKMWTSFECLAQESSRVNHLGNAQNIVENANLPNVAAPMILGEDINNPANKDQSPANRYIWTVPDTPTEGAVIRVRYNISTLDYEVYASGGSINGQEVAPLDARCADANLWDNTVNPCWTDKVAEVKTDARFNQDKKKGIESPVQQDPYIDVGDEPYEFVSLALNTNQYGRTFQDRSYMFGIKPVTGNANNVRLGNFNPHSNDPNFDAPSDACKTPEAAAARTGGCKVIHNLNTRGKRGNIVQTYPAVEYDFTPNRLRVETDDYIHFQWTGSDYNPRRGCNDAEGGPPDPPENVEEAKKNSRADRSNLLEVVSEAANMPANYTELRTRTGNVVSMFSNSAGTCDALCEEERMWLGMQMNTKPKNRNQRLVGKVGMTDEQDAGSCLTEEELNAIKNKNQRENHPNNCAKINNVFQPYFDAGPVKMRKTGTFKYFSSRNNNFSNRDQTGTICVGQSCSLKDTEEEASKAGIEAAAVSSIKKLASDEIPPVTDADILTTDTVTGQAKDNDAVGDGDQEGCEDEGYDFFDNVSSTGIAGFAVGIFGVGALATLLVFYTVRRARAAQLPNPDARQDKTWLREQAQL